ncbi:hypothetical protein KUTeg_015980 [Tegillarca granosa]|uniref:Synaptonemal complex protein 2 Spt16M-like domain-containing protein n=1 Tax=Tegillarca granosa TaxID=220873 RepID=A0ABQ9EJS4_TEGGR|nr:hypothetical protein KUTeg_015980 [Tegillarca granosa]
MMKQIKKLQDLLEEGLQTNILPDKDILKAAINKSCTNLDALLNTPDGAKDVQNLLYAVQNVLLQDKPLFLDLLFQCQIQILMLQIFKTLLSENCKKIVNEEDVGGVFEQLLDVVNGIAELSSSAKGSMVTDFLEYSLDLLIRNDVCFRHRMEALKSTNLLLENCPFAVKDRFLKSDLFLNKLNVVINQLPNFGDYEFQVGLIECLFRIIPRKQRESYAVHFFSNAEFSNGLLQIQDNDFETDCRLFLNDFNKSLGVTKRVLSLPCTSAFLGDKELYKPNEPGYDEFWVDFNLTSQRVTIFCEQGSMSSQNSADDLWETVTVWIKDLQNFGITRKKNYVVAHLFLQKSISEIFPSQCDVYGKEVQFHFDPIVDVEDALLKTFGNKYFIKKPEPKVSAVNNPILISSKRNDTKECSSKQQEQQEQQQLHSSDMSSSQFSQGTPSLYRRKVSVPCVPMSTPRSVSSLKSYPNDNVFSKNKTCVNDIRQNKHFSDLDDSSKSACSRNFSAPPSDIPDDCQKPKTKNNCKGMLDKDYMNQKKEFQIPKTPKQTRSKVKVKTPVVMITPRTETGNGKGKGKKNKDDDKRGKVKDASKDLKEEDSAEEMVKNRKKTTQKKKSQCDKLIKEEICLSQRGTI